LRRRLDLRAGVPVDGIIFFIREVPGDNNKDTNFYVLRILTPKNSDRYWTGTRKYRKKERSKDCPASLEFCVKESPDHFLSWIFFLHHVNEFPDGGDLMYKTEKFFFSDSVVFV
jgi:hypothetical protein